MNLPHPVESYKLYIYCNIAENVIVGEITAPLLRIVEIKLYARRAVMHTIIYTPLFVPVQKKKSFETTQIWIMTDMGEPAPFRDDSGKSHVVLELKKSRLLDNLIYKKA